MDMSISRRQLSLAALVAMATSAAPSLAVAAPSLAYAFSGKLLFGFAVTPEQLDGGLATELIERHSSVLVAENAMKPDALAGKGEGIYDFATADRVVAFAAARGIKVRGHTLLWHRQMPEWFFRDGAEEVNRATLISRIERYIADVVGHFKGRVFAWDVVNEALVADEPGTAVDAAGLRLSPLRDIVGPEFIEIAFRAAARADPGALLFYNDYETQNPRKVALISALVRHLRERGVKIDGIGHQAHCSMAHPMVHDFERAIDQYGALGLIQHITELDIALNQQLMENLVSAATPALLQRQSQRYADLVNLFLRKRDKVHALLVWGLSDANSWLTSWPMPRFEAPLLFDAQLQPKPAFEAVLRAARQAR